MNEYAGKTCIVTGGAGAIGSRLCKRLLELDAKVHVYDDLSSGFEWLLPEGAELLTFDVREFRNSAFSPVGCIVFHLAAHFANQNSVDHPFDDLHTNGEGTLAVLDWAAGCAERVVFASAGCAAGHEDTPYQIHKTLGEAYCRYFFDRVPTVVCRFHNSYGPGEVPGHYRNVIPNMLWNAMLGRTLTVYGDGTDGRDFIYVDDLVEDMIRALPSKKPVELGTGHLTPIADLVRAVLHVTKSKSSVTFEPRRRWDHPGRAASKFRMPFVPLPVGLQQTYLWMQENQEQIARSLR